MMSNRTVRVAAAGAAVLLPLALFLHTFSAAPLPMPSPYAGPLPSATPPKEMAVIALVTGVNHRVAAYGYRGGSFFDRREFSMAGTLVKHPGVTCSSILALAVGSTNNFAPCLGRFVPGRSISFGSPL